MNSDALVIFNLVKSRITLTYPAFIVGDSNTPDDENKTSMSQHIYQIRYIVHRALVEAQAQAAVQNVSLSPNIVRRWAHTLQTRRATKKIRTWQNTGNPGQPLQNDPLFHAEILAVKFLSKHNNNTRPFISMLRAMDERMRAVFESAKARIALLYPNVNPNDLCDPNDEEERAMAWHIRQIRYIAENVLLKAQSILYDGPLLYSNSVRQMAHGILYASVLKKVERMNSAADAERASSLAPSHEEMMALRVLGKDDGNTNDDITRRLEDTARASGSDSGSFVNIRHAATDSGEESPMAYQQQTIALYGQVTQLMHQMIHLVEKL
ncbi:hypothetical protein SCUCBS95973_007401 [Sporothrix curviconia]|uniref:Uncharacterized protein n=1 Tax=Sporothrix curviconia TaxID=1260050 RepID=A0ABP0CDP3_9PEZI